MENNFEVLFVADQNSDNLLAEIWLKDVLLCEVSHEGNQFEIEFFENFKGKVDYSSFLNTLQKAKSRLIGE